MAKTSKLLIPLAALLMAAGPIGCGKYEPSDPLPDAAAATKIRDGFAVAASKAPAAERGGGAAESEAKKFEGWATLKGRFVYAAAAPAATALKVDKDVEYCGKFGLVDQSLTVGADKGIAGIVVYARTPKIPVNDEYKKSADDKVVLNNHGCRFEPHVLGVRVGQTLTVKNSDPVAHNTKIAGDNLQINPLIPPGSSVDQAIDSPENNPVPVSCSIHEWMAAKLVVRPDPYFAVTDDTGRFEIKDLPAGGDVEFQVWQERAGGAALTDNADLAWTDKGHGRFQLNLKKGEVKDLGELQVPAAVFQK